MDNDAGEVAQFFFFFFWLTKIVNKIKNRRAMLLLFLINMVVTENYNKSRNRNALYMELEIHGECKYMYK